MIDKAREIGEAIGGMPGSPLGGTPATKDRRLTFAGMASTLARGIMPDHQKALGPSGAAVVGQEFKPDPVALGQPALSLLDVIPVVQHAIPEFAYLRQSDRTNSAAVVAAGTL